MTNGTPTTDAPERTFRIGDTVRWCWTGEKANGMWFTARLTAQAPPQYPSGWAGELVDPGTFYSDNPGWELGVGELVFLDEPSMTLVARAER